MIVPQTAQIRRPNTINGVIFWLLAVQMMVAIFYGGSIFFFSSSEDINNPKIPFAIVLFKDLFFFAVIGFLTLISFANNKVSAAFIYWAYIFVPLVLAALNMLLSTLKFNVSSEEIGILKNYFGYYFGAGLIVLLSEKYRVHLRLFSGFKLFMFLSIAIGIGLYARLFVGDIFHVTLAGRMIATLANPNLLGYLAVLYLAILSGEACYYGGYQGFLKFEKGVALIGLICSGSIAAILTYVLMLFLVMALTLTQILPAKKIFFRSLLLECFFIVAGIFGVLAFLSFIDLKQWPMLDFFLKIGVLVGSSDAISSGHDVTAGRMMALYAIRDEIFIGIQSMLMGSLYTDSYVKWDSGFINLIYNYGLLSFFLWFSYFSFPIVYVFSARRSLKVRFDLEVSLCYVLAAFLLASLSIHFWLQYASETYPTCLFIGWAQSFVVYTVAKRRGRSHA